MANAITRWVRLVFDKASGKQTEADAKKALTGIDGGLKKLGETAKRLGALLAAAFGIRALINFGKASIRAAAESEKAWNDLRGTINAAGVDFEKMQGRILASAQAFKDATTFDDDAFTAGLGRMVTLSGDVEASMANMGLAANVAAQFFGGDLASAVELVSKVMNGNVTMLGRMGIRVKDAQEGLDVLAQRSMGAAERQTKTFSGQVDILNRSWEDFRKAIGFAMIDAANGESILQRLSDTLLSMIDWVNENKSTLSEWGKVGISTVELVGGGLTIAFGAFTGAVILLTEGLIELVKIFNILPGAAAKLLTGKDPLGEYLDGAIARAEHLLGLSNDLIKMGGGAVSAAFTGSAGGGGAKGTIPNRRPMVSKNAPAGTADTTIRDYMMGKADISPSVVERQRPPMLALPDNYLADVQNVVSVLDDLGGQLQATDTKAAAFGDSFDATAERVNLLENAISNLATLGTPEAMDAIAGLTDQLDMARNAMKLGQEQAANYALAVANLSSLIAGAVGGDLKEVAKAKAKENLLLSAEELATGLVASLSLFGAGKAAGHFAAAAKYGAIAAGWGALGAAVGGGGSSGAAGAAGVSGSAATKAEKPQQEVNIYLVGPGFDAMNPAVQKVVYGAQQQARERYGDNAKVNLIRRTA
jgi:hypothetical protein